MTIVVNLRKEPYDVYIGRGNKYNHKGMFGNPYSEGTREQNIALFKEYFYERIFNDKEFEKRVLELKDKVLGCFCKPLPCHGDIIAEYLNNL